MTELFAGKKLCVNNNSSDELSNLRVDIIAAGIFNVIFKAGMIGCPIGGNLYFGVRFVWDVVRATQAINDNMNGAAAYNIARGALDFGAIVSRIGHWDSTVELFPLFDLVVGVGEAAYKFDTLGAAMRHIEETGQTSFCLENGNYSELA